MYVQSCLCTTYAGSQIPSENPIVTNNFALFRSFALFLEVYRGLTFSLRRGDLLPTFTSYSGRILQILQIILNMKFRPVDIVHLRCESQAFKKWQKWEWQKWVHTTPAGHLFWLVNFNWQGLVLVLRSFWKISFFGKKTKRQIAPKKRHFLITKTMVNINWSSSWADVHRSGESIDFHLVLAISLN